MDSFNKEAFNLKVETLNIWGLWLVSRNRRSRVRHLCDYLRTCSADLVLLQEVWIEDDADRLLEAASVGGLEHGLHFKSGLFGSGLVTLSRYPIVHTSFLCYSTAGDPMAFACGDFYAGKGVGWALVDSPIGLLDVYNTHLHANYSHQYSTVTPVSGDQIRVPKDVFAPYRLAQVWELTQFIKQTSRASSAGVVLAGDLNSKPETLEILTLRAELPHLHDSWDTLNPSSPGFTCRAPGNTYKSYRQVPERIDFIWTDWQPLDCKVVLKTTPRGYSFSDHFGVQATMRPSGTFLPSTRGDRVRQSLALANEVIDSGIQQAGWGALWCLAGAVSLWSFACILLAMTLASAPSSGGTATAVSGVGAMFGFARQHCGAVPLLTGMGFGACLLAPVLFVMGMLGYYPQQRALMRVSGQLAMYTKHFAQYK